MRSKEKEKLWGIQIVKPHAEMITPEIDPDWKKHLYKLIETQARTSYKSEERMEADTAPDFIKRHLKHESILEHGTFSAKVICSRACSHQLVRHRIGVAITQEPQRFCDYSRNRFGNFLQVIMPPSIYNEIPQHYMFKGKCFIFDESYEFPLMYSTSGDWEQSIDEYFEDSDVSLEVIDRLNMWIQCRLQNYAEYLALRREGVKAEDARYCLPNATKTEVALTANFRTWRHILCHPIFGRVLNNHAQWEIKMALGDILKYFTQEAVPEIFSDIPSQ